MDTNLWNIVVSIFAITLTIIAIINKEYRIYAIILAVVAVLFVVVMRNYNEISQFKMNNKKLTERLKIYKELIDMKADIKLIKGKIK